MFNSKKLRVIECMVQSERNILGRQTEIIRRTDNNGAVIDDDDNDE